MLSHRSLNSLRMPGQLDTIHRMLKKTVQQDRRRAETGGVPCGYVEDFDKPRTQLAGFFNTLSPWDDGFGSCHHLAVGADFGGGGLTA